MIHDFTLAQIKAWAQEEKHDELLQKIEELEAEIEAAPWKQSKRVIGNIIGREITDWGGDENE